MLKVNGSEILATCAKKLWDNAAAHTAHFPAQTISLDLSNYDYIAVRAKIKRQESNCITFLICKDGYPYQINYDWIDTSKNIASIAGRTYTCTDSGIVVSSGSIDIATTDNDFIVPWSIYGIQVV